MQFLYHISEDPNIKEFVPRKTAGNLTAPEVVWALDEKSVAHYYLPRDCPRIIYWMKEDTNHVDQRKYFPRSKISRKIMLLEEHWYRTIQLTTIYQYYLPASTFTCVDENAGYYGSRETVVPLKVELLTDLFNCLEIADIEIRFVPELKSFANEIQCTTLGFSMIRLRNAGKG